jgi:hypothetical protein
MEKLRTLTSLISHEKIRMILWTKLKEKHWDNIYEHSTLFRGAYMRSTSPPLRRFVGWLRKIGIDSPLQRIGLLVTIIGGIVAVYMAFR